MGQKTCHAIKNIKRAGITFICVTLLIFFFVLVGILWLALLSHPAAFDSEEAANISYDMWRQLIPSEHIPDALEVMSANNNLDVAHYQDHFYLAFRTAPTHFASDKTRLMLLRSKDRDTWEHAGEFAVGRDIREPRFLVFKDTLFLYFCHAGTHPLKFEPQHIFVTALSNDGTWAAPRLVHTPGFVVWRTRVHDDKAYMSVYDGMGLYTTHDRPGDLRLLVSEDGYNWQPISERPQVDAVGAEEGAFIFDDAGNLYATVRLETGGALVCRADKDNLACWECVHTPEKYDSALLFRHNGEVYGIARRNVAGVYASGADWLPKRLQRAWWLVKYSLTRKRTALYKLDTKTLTLFPVMDFPSKGDTAFAGIVALNENSYWVANYSCALDGPDWPWALGQLLGTQVYDTVLHFNK